MKKARESIVFKSLAGIVALLVIFALLIGVVGYNEFTEALLTQYADGAFRTANTAALVVDPDRMDEYIASGGQTAEYIRVNELLDTLCNSQDATFVYVIQPDTADWGHITFIFSTINHNSSYTHYEFGYVRETTNDDYRQKYEQLYTHRTERALVIRNKGYIETDAHITAMVPLIDSSGDTVAILCVQRQMDLLSDSLRAFIHKILITLVVVLALMVAGQTVYLNRTLLFPVRQITREAQRFAGENVTTGRKLSDTIKNKDEIGRLADSIDRMEEQIASYVVNLTRMTAENERISTELDLAAKIQEGMLPRTFPAFPDREEFSLFAAVDPAREVGGDYYDFFLIDEDHLALVMADVSGKGIPAALFMMSTMILISSNARHGLPPSEMLCYVNDAICSHNQQQMFVTVWLGILELSTGKLTAANAGHEYPALMRSGGRFEIFKDAHGFVVGGMEGMKYKDYTLQLSPGDKLFLYTDGVPEATDEHNEMFGTERMLEALNARVDADPENLLKGIREAVDRFVGAAEQFDDLTMMGLAYHGPKGV